MLSYPFTPPTPPRRARLLEKADGKVPVINEADMWLPDSDEIVKFLEDKVPQPSMKSDVPADVTGSVFGAFRGFLMAKVRLMCACD